MRAPRVGQSVTPNLRLLRPLGAGGMGSVWIARHHGLDTNVVVKFMSEDLVGNAEALARFRREAAAAADVRSPHVVQMLDHGVTAEGVPYIAMELLEGESLRQRLDRERVLPPSDVTLILSQCAKALGRAHERGVVHRDIKPDNIFLTDAGDGELFAKVLDFGIAKASDSNMAATATGTVMGSPYYMSPEQVLGAKGIDARTDLWALGVTAYEALTGARPFEAETIGALSIAICQSTPAPPSQLNPALPGDVNDWFARACARDPARRFASAKEMSDALAQALVGLDETIAQGLPVVSLGHTLPLLSTTAGVGVPATRIAEPSPPAPPTTRRMYALAGVAFAVVAIVIVLIAIVATRSGVSSVEPPATPNDQEATAKPKRKPSHAAPATAPSPSVSNEPAARPSTSAPHPAPAAPTAKPAPSTKLIDPVKPSPGAKPAPTKVQNDPTIF